MWTISVFFIHSFIHLVRINKHIDTTHPYSIKKTCTGIKQTSFVNQQKKISFNQKTQQRLYIANDNNDIFSLPVHVDQIHGQFVMVFVHLRPLLIFIYMNDDIRVLYFVDWLSIFFVDIIIMVSR